jgi:hypothetical protein
MRYKLPKVNIILYKNIDNKKHLALPQKKTNNNEVIFNKM